MPVIYPFYFMKRFDFINNIGVFKKLAKKLLRGCRVCLQNVKNSVHVVVVEWDETL